MTSPTIIHGEPKKRWGVLEDSLPEPVDVQVAAENGLSRACPLALFRVQFLAAGLRGSAELLKCGVNLLGWCLGIGGELLERLRAS